MYTLLHSSDLGKIAMNEQARVRQQITERWDKIGLLDGLKGQIKDNIATLYESQAGHMLMTEATSADNSGSFETVVFPIIRRVFSKLLANDIVSVQALNLPVGKLFYFIPQTSQRTWLDSAGTATDTMADGVTASHDGMMGYKRYNHNYVDTATTTASNPETENRFYIPDEVVPTGIASKADYFDNKNYKKSLYDLFYNDFLYDNSKGKITIREGKNPAAVRLVGSLNGSDFIPVSSLTQTTGASSTNQVLEVATDGTVRSIILKITGFSAYNAGRLTGPDGNEMDSETFLSSLKVVTKAAIAATVNTAVTTASYAALESVPFRVVTQQYGKGMVSYDNICDATGAIYVELMLHKPVTAAAGTDDGFIGVDQAKLAATAADQFQVFWAQYDSLELETEIGEVSFALQSVTVSTVERKLRATWSPELAQDVAAFQNIDAEAELTDILSEEIGAEIDREILRDLRKASPWQMKWDANGWRRMAGFSTNYTKKDWNQELITCVNQVSAQIFKSTLRGGANFVVVSAEISALFDNLEYFHVSDASAESDQYNMGIERIGSLSGRYQVYRDPYAPAWSMIIGHKGKSLLDSGFVYSPYIPLQLTPVLYNPFNAAPIKYIMTRYAKKMVNNRYYGAVVVSGLQTWNVNELR